MNKTREKIDLSDVEKLYGPISSVEVVGLFYDSYPGITGPTGFSQLPRPMTLEDAADTDASRFELRIRSGDKILFPQFLRDELIKPRFDRSKPRVYLSGRLLLRFLDDPETPVLVEYRVNQSDTRTGTYGCVTAEGNIDGWALSDKQREWLQDFEDETDTWYELKRVHS